MEQDSTRDYNTFSVVSFSASRLRPKSQLPHSICLRKIIIIRHPLHKGMINIVQHKPFDFIFLRSQSLLGWHAFPEHSATACHQMPSAAFI